MTAAPPDGRAGIDADLVTRTLAEQAPQWARLPIRPVPVDGWDNRTYRLGDDLVVRLPTAPGYAAAVDKEDRWLPVLAPLLPLAVPVPVLRGRPGQGYPHPWSVRRWIDGETVPSGPVDDVRLAEDLAGFLRELRAVPPGSGPLAGEHSSYRGSPPGHYEVDTRSALDALAGVVDVVAAQQVWQDAVSTRRSGPPQWFHGDIAWGNLLVGDGRLRAVIDFGTCGVGDPACDLVIAWTTFTGVAREAFRRALPDEGASWTRARGWALWKALITLEADVRSDRPPDPEQRRVVEAVLADR